MQSNRTTNNVDTKNQSFFNFFYLFHIFRKRKINFKKKDLPNEFFLENDSFLT